MIPHGRSGGQFETLLGDNFPDVVVSGTIGRGWRCVAVAARSGDREIVIKLYHARAIARHARQYGGSLAQFEYERNLTFHRCPGFAAFSAEPIGFRSLPGAEVFLQERIFGEPLMPFLRTSSAECRRRLNADLRTILERAEQAGLLDLDLHHSNIIVRRSRDGIARPVLFDFNKVPYRVRRPSGVLSWCRHHGLIGYPSHDHRHLRRFERTGRSFVERFACAAGLV